MTGRRLLAGGALLAGAAVLLDERVLWAGQPDGDPTGAAVSGWYDAHVGRVLLGDVLWLAAATVLAAAVWVLTAALPVARTSVALTPVVRVLGLAAAAGLAASALLAARLALGAGGDALTTWRAEGAAYRTGTLLLGLATAGLALGLARTGHVLLAVPVALVGVLLVVPALSTWGLVGACAVLAAAIPATGATPARRRAGAPSR